MNSEFVQKQIDAYQAKFDKLKPKFLLAEAEYNDLSAKLAYLHINTLRDKKLLEEIKAQEFIAQEKQRVAAEQPKPIQAEAEPQPSAIVEVQEDKKLIVEE